MPPRNKYLRNGGLNRVIEKFDLGVRVTELKHRLGSYNYVDIEVFANGTIAYSVAE